MTIHVRNDAKDRFAEGVVRALLMRANVPGGERNEFSGFTLAEIARNCLREAGDPAHRADRMQMIGAAFTARNSAGMHTSSDFGSILASTASRALAVGYEEAEETFHLWTSAGSASDFRPISRSALGLFPALDKVAEHSEYQYATIGDSSTAVQLATYGKMFSISRQAIINDDLEQFSKIPRRMGQAAKRTIGGLVYQTLTANPMMQDGVALFHASHGNLASSPAAITEASLGAARAAMSRQTDEAGVATSIGVKPKFLLVPPELIDAALKLIHATTSPGDAGLPPNSVRGMATVVSDSRLTGSAWYVAGDPAEQDTIEVTYLDGNDEPTLEQQDGWTTDGTTFKVRLDAAVKALHWRALFKNAGA